VKGADVSFDLTFIQKSGYLHAVVTGLNTRENVEAYLANVLRECHELRCSRVLIEERLEGPRLGPVDVFDIAAGGSNRIGGVLQTIAYVDVHGATDTMKFAETVAINRGAPVRIFATVADAEKWLAGSA
jgi:hypothetical protein